MTTRCYRCDLTKEQLREKGGRISYWVRHKKFKNLFVCNKCDKEIKDIDPVWAEIEKCWRILGGWSKDDQKRYEEHKRRQTHER